MERNSRGRGVAAKAEQPGSATRGSLGLPLGANRPIEHLGHRLEVPRAVVAHAVHEERRRAVHAAAHAAVRVCTNLLEMLARLERGVELFGVETELRHDLVVELCAEALLVLEQRVVNLPEAVVRGTD